MIRHDRMRGLIWFILGIAIIIGSIALNLGSFRKPGPGFMPFISGALLAIVGLILLIYSNISKRLCAEDKRRKEIRTKANFRNFVLILAALFSYILLMEPVGFIFTTFLFLFFTFKLTEPKKWVAPLVFSVSAVILSYIIFSVWLKCQFPKGIFPF